MRWQNMETEFFRSAQYLCASYGIALPDVSAYAFPNNVATAHAQIEAALEKQDKAAVCVIGQDESHRASLAVIKTYDTGRCLYYVPVRPLWRLCQQAQDQSLADLLLSVFAYLFQVAKVPSYAENGSYLSCQYDSLQNWIWESEAESEEELAYKEEQEAEMDALLTAGTELLVQMQNPTHLAAFEARLKTYRETETWDIDIEAVAEEFLALWRKYPLRTLYDNIRPDLIEPQEEDRIDIDWYVSFYWSCNDCFYDVLFDMVNNEFGECGVTDEPVAIQWFDGAENTQPENFDFEKRLLDGIDRLCSLLNPYDK